MERYGCRKTGGGGRVIAVDFSKKCGKKLASESEGVRMWSQVCRVSGSAGLGYVFTTDEVDITCEIAVKSVCTVRVASTTRRSWWNLWDGMAWDDPLGC
jgi:hypothetical protein